VKGADLRNARMERKDLYLARMKGTKNLRIRANRSAAFNSLDHSEVRFGQAQFNEMFGDASVILPERMDRPAHWPEWTLPYGGEHDFDTEWRKWLDDPEGYTPPPKPGD